MNRADKIEQFYSDSVSVWKKILGPELHYHFGHFENENTTYEQAMRCTVENFYSSIPKGSRVLDSGCGWGGPARMLRDERACKVHGITISATQAEHCRKTGLHAQVGDLELMELQDQNYDLVFMMEALGHIKNKSTLLQKFARISNKLILRVNCTADLVRALYGASGSWLGYLETPETIVKRLERSGWQIETLSNRRAESFHSLEHWKSRLENSFGEQIPEGQLKILHNLCTYALSRPEQWIASNPLLDIVATREP